MSQNEHDPASVQPVDVSALETRIPRPSELASDGRRRFVLGGVVATPAIITLASRPAFAGGSYGGGGGGGGGGQCTISGWKSGNLSKPDDVKCKGLTRGCWQTHPKSWPSPYVAGPCNPITQGNEWSTCADYSVPTSQQWDDWINDPSLTPQQKSWRQNKKAWYLLQPKGTKVRDPIAFGSGMPVSPTDLTLMQALWDGGGLLQQAIASLLNAAYFGKDAFGYTPSELVQLVLSRMNTDPAQLQEDLEMLNGDRPSPTGESRHGTCPSK